MTNADSVRSFETFENHLFRTSDSKRVELINHTTNQNALQIDKMMHYLFVFIAMLVSIGMCLKRNK